MTSNDAAAQVVGLLIDKLDRDTLQQVFTQLVGRAVTIDGLHSQSMRGLKTRDFIRALGCSDSYFYALKARGKIPPGQRIGAQLTIWTPQEIAATVVALADEQRERDEQSQLARTGSAMLAPARHEPAPVQDGRRRGRGAPVPAPPRDPPP
jgi:predicted DNA-binding transcriptional regulator AlpA